MAEETKKERKRAVYEYVVLAWKGEVPDVVQFLARNLADGVAARAWIKAEGVPGIQYQVARLCGPVIRVEFATDVKRTLKEA